MSKQFPYVWVIKQRLRERHGQRCRLRGRRDGAAIVVELEDGTLAVAHPSAVRRLTEGERRKAAR